RLGRSEGVVLRYLTDAWRTLDHSVPQSYRTEELEDIIEWLGELIRQVDSSLLDEWATLSDPDAPLTEEQVTEHAFGVTDSSALSANKRALRRMVRNHMRSEEHTSELQSRFDLVCRLLLEKKNQRQL